MARHTEAQAVIDIAIHIGQVQLNFIRRGLQSHIGVLYRITKQLSLTCSVARCRTTITTWLPESVQGIDIKQARSELNGGLYLSRCRIMRTATHLQMFT